MQIRDPLGDRIKRNYEDRTRFYLPRRTNIIIRLDGKAFHTFTRGMGVFDGGFAKSMEWAAAQLFKHIQGSKLVYTQSDEISIWVTDYDRLATDAPFDGNLQKLCSVSSSIVTAEFNDRFRQIRSSRKNLGLGYFDSRVFVVPEIEEVANYFLWRVRDCERNSIQSYAQSVFSHGKLHNKSLTDIHEMLYAEGKNWATDVDDRFRNGWFYPQRPVASGRVGFEEIHSLVETLQRRKND